jgi:hypothetical protein
VPSRAIVKVGIVVGKKKSAGHCSTARLLAIISLNSINQPIFAIEKRCVFFAVRTAMVMLLRQALIFHMLLCGNSAREHNTVHSTMANYI